MQEIDINNLIDENNYLKSIYFINSSFRKISKNLILSVVKARLDEIFDTLKKQLIIPGLNLTSGISFFLTGSGSNLLNIEKYFINFFGPNLKRIEKNNIEKDWPFEERLSKEFEAIGFFISDHPINEYKEVFDIYKIQNFNSFMISSKNEAILAATIMKIQEKKTRDGNSFSIVKFSDLGGVFELFLFSEILEQSRNILKEGKSFLITVLKDLSNQNNRFKRTSVKKLVSLNEISKQSIPNITFEIEKFENLNNFSNLISKKGNTNVKIVVKNNSKNLVFELSEKRKINPEILKSLKNKPYLMKINI